MSGPVGSQHWMYASGGFYPYSIDQSLRFDGSSAYLNFTPSSSTTGTVTISAWVKRSKVGVTQYLFASGAVNARGNIGFNASDQLFFQGFNSTGANSVLTSSMLFRDVSAWYHIVVECDGVTTTSNFPTNTNVYVNGLTISMTHSTASSPSGGFRINDTQVKNIGRLTPSGSSFFSGYMSEIHWIDGTAVDASNFGETINGVWVPKEYTGSHGSAGYYLSFADSSAIGDDLSGNGNDWTANNLAASDVMSGESPTNNFATFNPLDISGTTLTYSEGNLKAERTSSSFAQAYSSFSFDSGKWYAEILPDTGNHGIGVIAGITNPGANRYMGQDSYTYGYYSNGQKVNSATYTNYGDTWTGAADGSGDVIGIYIDADNGDIYFSKNGTVQNSGTAAFTGVTGPFRFAIASESNAFHIANFGQDDSFTGLKTSGSAAASDDNGNGVFYDTIGLSGYLAPCSANLPEPTIGPNSAEQADDHFNTLLYTGDGATSRSITGVGFAPDFVWGKCRSNAEDHILSDTVRGANKKLEGNNTGTEDTSTAATLSGFESDGFTGPSSTPGNINVSGRTYVAWNWKAGGTAVSNTDGSITSSVSAAPDAGFSIVSYTGTGANATIGHGLSSAPEMIIIKARTRAENWLWYHKFDGGTDGRSFLNLNTTGAKFDNGPGSYFQDTPPTASVFYQNNSSYNQNTDTYIAYCFHSVEGYCKIGSFVGNSSTDGTFVHLGFRPAWVLIKSTSSSTNSCIFDSKRLGYNVDNNLLRIAGATEQTDDDVDFLSNGLKFRRSSTNFNNSSHTYVYIAFAETPFKYSVAR